MLIRPRIEEHNTVVSRRHYFAHAHLIIRREKIADHVTDQIPIH